MKILVLLIIAASSLLSACSSTSSSPYAYDGQKRGVVGEFCPAKEAIKGNC